MTLELIGIRKQVADEVYLHDLDIEFRPGLNVLAGPTLAGKTTILRMIAGLDKADRGRIVLNAQDITAVPVRRRGIAVVYQQYINYPNFTVYENIASPLRLAKLSNNEIDKRVRETAELLAISDYLQRLPSELSGGQQQRTAIARALVKEAAVILLDEPLVNLDYKLREQLRRELRNLFAGQNKIAIYATTEPLEAALLGDHLVVIDKGRALQMGAAADLWARPVELRVAEILSDPRINVIDVEVRGGVANCRDQFSIDLSNRYSLADGDYCLAIRPHQLHLKTEHLKNADVLHFGARVSLAEVSGSETLIHIEFGNCQWIVQQAGVHQYGLGETIELVFAVNDILLFNASGESLIAGNIENSSRG